MWFRYFSLPIHTGASIGENIDLAKDFKSFKRAKHIDRRINFLTDYQELGELEVVHIGTSMNTADVFTKPLSKSDFLKHASALVKP